MIESLGRAPIGPADQREVLAGVLGVATGAGLGAHAGVQSPIPLSEPADLFVAIHAQPGHLRLAARSVTAGVALHALQPTFQPLVRTGERSGRDLPPGHRRCAETQQREHERAPHHNQVAPSATTTMTCTSTATSAAIATGRWNTCQYRKMAWVASRIRTCWANATPCLARRTPDRN